MTTAGLKVDRLGVRYVGRRDKALDGIDLHVAEGELVSVTGRTGSGKSTLALAAAGFIPRVVKAQVTGSVAVGDIEATTARLADLAGQVGIVFSAPALQLSASKPTVREELAFGLENLAVPRAEMDERVDVVLDRLGIADLAEREPLALSGGSRGAPVCPWYAVGAFDVAGATLDVPPPAIVRRAPIYVGAAWEMERV